MDTRPFAFEIARVYAQFHSSYKWRFTTAENVVVDFFQSCPFKYVREATIKGTTDEGRLILAKITNNVWETCFNILTELNTGRCCEAVDKLLHISDPENEFRADFIDNFVRNLINSNLKNDFYHGIDLAINFDLEDIKSEEFDTIIYRSYLHNYEKALQSFLNTEESQIRYLDVLRGTLNLISNGELCLNKYEKMFCNKISSEDLFDIIEAESIKYRLTEEYEIFGNYYHFIDVTTSEEFDNFIQTYLVESPPSILGIDCETNFTKGLGHEVTLLQLATKYWVCLIDVQLLPKQDWMKLFKNIFDSNIIRVGFHFAFDFSALCNTFPYLQEYLEQNGQVLCLYKLIHVLNKNPVAKNAVFSNVPLNSKGLAYVSEALLGIKIDKSLQRSDWTQRPLTQDQKLYAVKDALVVVLLKERFEHLLTNQLGANMCQTIMDEAFISYSLKWQGGRQY